MKLTLIAAVAADRGIGRGNALLFTDPEDQRHFRATTTGHPVVMGRKTWESLPPRFRPLPGRRNVVLSRDESYAAPGAEIVGSLDAALALLREAPQVFVLGGAEVYAEALPRAGELVLTEIGRTFEGADAFFPPWREAGFVEVARREAKAQDGTALAFVTYRRR